MTRSELSIQRAKGVIVPPSPLPGADLIAASDLVISAGGTINREAAALGVPTEHLRRDVGVVDEQLVKEGRLRRISSYGST